MGKWKKRTNGFKQCIQTMDSKELEKMVESSYTLQKLTRELEESKQREHQREMRVKELMEELAIREKEVLDLTRDNRQMKKIVEGIQGHIKAKEKEADRCLKEKNIAISEMKTHQNRNKTLMSEIREEGRVVVLEAQIQALETKLKDKEDKILELEKFIDANIS